MPTYRMKDKDSILPGWLKRARTKEPVTITAVRIKFRDGGSMLVDPNGPFTVTEERAVRHLDADPRFEKISDLDISPEDASHG